MDILTANDRSGAYPASWYGATADLLAPFGEAAGDIRCDVCVIGGGFTGLSAALHLAKMGYDVVLLEAHRVGWGASGRNGGQVGTGQRLEQDALERMVGRDDAKTLWQVGLQSVAMVGALIKTHDIACAYTPGIIHADHRKRLVRHSHAYVDKLRGEYGYEQITPLDREQICARLGTTAYFGGALDMGSGHLHPLNYALGLARAAKAGGVRIFERSRVRAVTQGSPATVRTARASVSADFVVVGANGYLGDLLPRVGAHVMAINNFIVATEPLGQAGARALIRDNHAVADSKFVINYFRLSEDHRLLFGGGETYGTRFPKDIAALVSKPMLAIYPQLRDVRIDYAWGGTLGITMSRMPHFARLAGNILSAGGFSGHGVAMATLAGAVMADAVHGQAAAFDVMARVPTPRFPGGTRLQAPLLALAMTWFALRDRL